MSLKHFIKKAKSRILPNEHEREVQRWFADGGDEAFRYNYDLDERSIVLDFGGYEGEWADQVSGRFKSRIYVFEPVNKFAQQISDRFVDNSAITVLPFALGKEAREDEIHLSGDGSSTFGKDGEGESIQVMDAKNWIEQNIDQASMIDLIKLNIEGGEYELLDRLIEIDWIPRIKNIQVQFHDIAQDSAARMEAIQQSLMRTHRPTYQYRFVWENWELQ